MPIIHDYQVAEKSDLLQITTVAVNVLSFYLNIRL